MLVIKLLFWFCCAVFAWETVLFPVVLWALARVRRRTPIVADITPSVCVVITTHNEATNIARKIEDVLAFDYPADKLEILVADDASDDGTADVVQTFADRSVTIIRQETWRGKTAAQNLAITAVCSEIVLFSDATAFYNAGALRAMVRHFADPTVGCVTGRVALATNVIADGTTTAAGLNSLLGYEQSVRKQQGAAFSLFGATGCIYAIRRELYTNLPEEQVSDLVLPLLLLERGYRTVYESEAVATLERPISAEREFARRSRIVLQCLRAMWYMRRLLLPWRSGVMLSSIALYRLLRWLLPIVMLGLLGTNTMLAVSDGGFYTVFLIAQLIVYGSAMLGGICEALHIKAPLIGLPFLFLWINAAAGMALLRLIKGEKAAAWETKR